MWRSGERVRALLALGGSALGLAPAKVAVPALRRSRPVTKQRGYEPALAPSASR